MKILTNYDFNQNQITNAVIQNLATAPSTPVQGQVYFNTTSKRLFSWNGTEWIGADATGATMTGADIVAAINGTTSLIDNDNLSSAANNAINKAHDATHASSHITGGSDVIASFTSTASGLTPLSGGGTTKYLRADGTWVVPPDTDTIYEHPTGDGSSHVPATSTTNSGKVLTAGDIADSASWQTPSVAWTNIGNKPSSATTDIDAAVTSKHDHTNKTTLDTYTQTETNLAAAVSKKHSQNTDTGTANPTFTVGSAGVKIKNSAGTELQVRNNADTDYADLRVNNLVVEGATTSINSNEVNIGDSSILLNADITANNQNSDGGISVKRLMADNTTRKDAVCEYNNSTHKWQTTQGDVANALVTAQIANKVTATVGDGSATSYVITHNLNSRDLVINIRETASPYALVITDAEMTTLNTITLKFATAPAVNAYTVTIIG